MVTSRTSIQSFGFCFLMLLAGCGKKKQSVVQTDTYSEKRDGIELYAKRLSGSATHKQFGRNLITMGYQPIKITVVNNSTDQVLMRASSIDLPLVTAGQTCLDTERSVLGILAGPAYLSVLFAWPVLVPILGIGTWLAARNHYVKGKICEKFFGEDKVIELLPFERVTRFIFVPVVVPIDRFNVYLFKREEKTFVPFTINLP